jgi:superfamily I DNA and/or RNA helicase
VASLVRSNADGVVGALLDDKRRVNVMLSRAKAKIILVGSASTLSQSESVARARAPCVLSGGAHVLSQTRSRQSRSWYSSAARADA